MGSEEYLKKRLLTGTLCCHGFLSAGPPPGFLFAAAPGPPCFAGGAFLGPAHTFSCSSFCPRRRSSWHTPHFTCNNVTRALGWCKLLGD